MRGCPKMERLIFALFCTRSKTTRAESGQMRLENPPYPPLVITMCGKSLLAVEQGENRVVFFTGASPWVPLEAAHRGEYRAYAEPDGKGVRVWDPEGQEKLAAFVETWAERLDWEKWLVRAYAVEVEGKKAAPSLSTVLPRMEHMGAPLWVAQGSASTSQKLYHAVWVGHLTALRAATAALKMGHDLVFPPPSDAYAQFSVRRLDGILYRSRIVGNREHGLYTAAIWADNADLLEKEQEFYLVDMEAAPVSPWASVSDSLSPSKSLLRRFYAWLNEAVSVPLRREWAGELWEKGIRKAGLISPLWGWGCAVFLVQADEEGWTEVVQGAVRGG